VVVVGEGGWVGGGGCVEGVWRVWVFGSNGRDALGSRRSWTATHPPSATPKTRQNKPSPGRCRGCPAPATTRPAHQPAAPPATHLRTTSSSPVLSRKRRVMSGPNCTPVPRLLVCSLRSGGAGAPERRGRRRRGGAAALAGAPAGGAAHAVHAARAAWAGEAAAAAGGAPTPALGAGRSRASRTWGRPPAAPCGGVV
jgi:hypothetical protein